MIDEFFAFFSFFNSQCGRAGTANALTVVALLLRRGVKDAGREVRGEKDKGQYDVERRTEAGGDGD